MDFKAKEAEISYGAVLRQLLQAENNRIAEDNRKLKPHRARFFTKPFFLLCRLPSFVRVFQKRRR